MDNSCRRFVVFVIACLVLVQPAWPQAGGAQTDDQEYRTAMDSFGDEYHYKIGEDLNPKLEINGVRWNLVRVRLRKPDHEPEPGKSVDVIVDLGFENTTGSRSTIAVVLLFEDEAGRKLGERLVCDQERLHGGASKIYDQKHEITYEMATQTAKLYVYCEVS
jgi:hypothetical protein